MRLISSLSLAVRRNRTGYATSASAMQVYLLFNSAEHSFKCQSPSVNVAFLLIEKRHSARLANFGRGGRLTIPDAFSRAHSPALAGITTASPLTTGIS